MSSNECTRCHRRTVECDTCKGRGSIQFTFGHCTTCDGTGRVCTEHGKHWHR